MSDGNDKPGTMQQVTGRDTAGVAVGLDAPFDLLSQFLKTSADVQMKWLDLVSVQTLINLRALQRAIDPNIPSGSQRYYFGLDFTDKRHFDAMGAFIHALPEPVRSILRAGTPTEANYLEWRKQPQVLKAFQRLYENKLFFPQVGELAKAPYNRSILVEDSKGEITPIDPMQIVSLFQATPLNGMKKPTTYPHVIVTSSHANGSSLRDVTNITHGIEAMADGAWGKPLKLVDFKKDEHGKTVINDAASDANLMLYMCDSRDSPDLNGIDLLFRLNERDEVLEKGTCDPFKEVSPGTKRMAKLMLASLCEDYCGPDGTPKFDVNDPRPISEILKDGSVELHLSDDSRRILARWKGMGYSKGGETVKSALSYLREELIAPNDRNRGIVRPSYDWPEDKGLRNLGDYGVRSLLGKTMALIIASPARRFSEDEKNDGCRAESFVNKYDGLLRNDHMESSWNDRFHVMNGISEDPHNPVLTMGKRDGKGGYTHGWLTKDPEFKRYLQEYFASNYGKAAIANIYVETKTDELKIEAAAGTPDDVMFDYGEHIEAALKEQGITNPKLTLDKHNIGVMTLTANQDLLADPEALLKVGQAFNALRDEPDSGLVIARSISDVNIPNLVQKAFGRRAAQTPVPHVAEVTPTGKAAAKSVNKPAPGQAA